MVKQKNEKVKKNKKASTNYRTEEQETIIRFGIILGVVLIFILGVYFFTKVVVKKETTSTSEITKGTINYKKTIVGNMLNKPSKEYYVFAYDGNSNYAIKYSAIIDSYMKKDKAKDAYWIDLSNELNKNHVANDKLKENTNTKEINELVFGDFALIKVKNNKIDSIITDIDKATKELKIND